MVVVVLDEASGPAQEVETDDEAQEDAWEFTDQDVPPQEVTHPCSAANQREGSKWFVADLGCLVRWFDRWRRMWVATRMMRSIVRRWAWVSTA